MAVNTHEVVCATATVPSHLEYRVYLPAPCGGRSTGGTTRSGRPQLLEDLQDMARAAQKMEREAKRREVLVSDRLAPGVATFLKEMEYTGEQHFQHPPTRLDLEHLRLISAKASNYTVRVNNMKKYELHWAGYVTGLRLLGVTHEEQMTSFERAELTTMMCSLQIVLSDYGVEWNEEIFGEASLVQYSAPEVVEYDVMEEFVLFNSLAKFAHYLALYATTLTTL